ncbi:MAG TPA: hypothetical protein PK431_16985 [Chitinophagales bacterium]|nr:hypothetical protein [Chitinophagales bacterium]
MKQITSENMELILKTLNELTLFAEGKFARAKDNAALNKIDEYHLKIYSLLQK